MGSRLDEKSLGHTNKEEQQRMLHGGYLLYTLNQVVMMEDASI